MVRELDVRSRTTEQEWLAAHSHEYRGQWVALEGDALLSHGTDARCVRDEARERGIHRPLHMCPKNRISWLAVMPALAFQT